MKSIFPTAIAAAALSLAAFAGSASAQVSEPLNITLNVDSECLLQVEDHVENTTGITAEMQFSVDVGVLCNNGTPYEIAIDQGQNFGQAQPDMRALSSGSAFIAYALSQDAARTTPWGEGSSTVNGVGNANWNLHTAYGEFYVNGATTGSYTDDLVVTVSWD